MRHFSYLRYLLLAFMLTVGGAAAADTGDSIPQPYGYYAADSLKQLLNTPPLTEKRKMELYRAIADYYHPIESDSSIVYYHKAIVIAQELNEYESLMYCYYMLGTDHSFKGNYETAFACFDRAKELAVEHGNKEIETLVLSLTGFTYAKQGKHNTAIDYYLKYLKVSENEGWTINCVRALANLSEINRRLGNTETAFQYLKLAEEKCNKFEKDDYYKSTYKWWMPQIYNEYAFNYFNKGDHDEALLYALKADSINAENGTINRCYTKGLLASIYLQRNDYDRALLYAGESYKHADILKDVSLYVNAGKILSDVYLAQKRYREAETEAFKAWQIDSTNIDESRALVENIALANIYMGNLEKAAYYLKKYSELNAQYSEKTFQTIVADLSVKYETEKKEVRIAVLEGERKLYTGMAAAIVLALLLGIGLLFYLHRSAMQKRKLAEQQIKQLEQEKKLIAAQAALNAETAERKMIARDLHDGVGAMLSVVKNNMNRMKSYSMIENTAEDYFNRALDGLDQSIAELRRVAHHIMPAVLIEKGLPVALDDFCRSIPQLVFHVTESDYRFNSDKEITLYRCAYELVNNALRHSGASRIDVHLTMDEKTVYLSVVDNGCGFDLQTTAMGMGISNLRERLADFDGRMDIYSETGKGTEVNVELEMFG